MTPAVEEGLADHPEAKSAWSPMGLGLTNTKVFYPQAANIKKYLRGD
ncbi:hypothetical protein [Spirosoma migulaei]